MLSLVNRLAASIGSSDSSLDVPATYADVAPSPRHRCRPGALIESIKFPADPAMIVNLKRSVAGYANGSVALKAWLDADGPASNPYGLDVQSFTASTDALNSANRRIGEDFAAGTLPCDARF